jgi:hypothetical protein
VVVDARARRPPRQRPAPTRVGGADRRRDRHRRARRRPSPSRGPPRATAPGSTRRCHTATPTRTPPPPPSPLPSSIPPEGRRPDHEPDRRQSPGRARTLHHDKKDPMADTSWHSDAYPELRPGPPWVMQEMIAAQPALTSACSAAPPRRLRGSPRRSPPRWPPRDR